MPLSSVFVFHLFRFFALVSKSKAHTEGMFLCLLNRGATKMQMERHTGIEKEACL